MTALPPLARSQSNPITGTVRDEKGNPLTGATITVKNSKISTTSDAKGSFTISMPPNSKTLLISYVGMQSVEQTVNGSTAGTIVLKATSGNLGDVVVVAYGTVKKKDLTGAVETLSWQRPGKRAARPTSYRVCRVRFPASWSAKATEPPALVSTSRSADRTLLSAPSRSMSSTVYLISSATATLPPASVSTSEQSSVNALSFLNPNDIESITVLKDASATAIYGSRGSNGVVIITTKKGRKGEDRVELNATYGVSRVMKEIKMLDAFGYATMQNEAITNTNYFEPGPTPRTLPYPGELQQSPTNPDSTVYFPGPKDFIGKSTDWQKEIFQTGITNNYSLNISRRQRRPAATSSQAAISTKAA